MLVLYHHLLQARHKEEIEQIRSAGHDSLAMIVEEYKVGGAVWAGSGFHGNQQTCTLQQLL